jgi:cell division protein FtsZ
MNQAREGIAMLKEQVDTLITIPNDRLLSIAGTHATLLHAFGMVDDVLGQAVRGISELITAAGIINVDFADVRTIMSEKGMALMGSGTMEGDNRAVAAAQAAISSPLLDNISIEGARGVLINIKGPSDMTLAEVHEAASLIQEAAHEDANIIFGQVIDDRMENKVQVTVIATAFGEAANELAGSDIIPMRVAAQRVQKAAEPARKQVEDYDTPSFIRKNESGSLGTRIARVSGSDAEFADEYDIPTFLRKQAD